MYTRVLIRVVICIVFLFTQQLSYAQENQIEGVWYNQEKTAKIKIYKAKNSKYYGKIDWLETPVKDGKERVDENNPDKSKRNDPLMGLMVLKGFVQDDDDTYEDGTIYDPKNGKTYSCIITYKGDKLDVRGYVGFSWIGRTAVWSKVE